MKENNFKSNQLKFQSHSVSVRPTHSRFPSQIPTCQQPLNQLRMNPKMLPILPKRRENPIRNKQLQNLREKQNKMLAFYFYQKALSQKEQRSQQAKQIKRNEQQTKRNHQSQKCSPRQTSHGINHYSFLQLKQRISEKSKYPFWQGFKGKRVIMS